MVELAFAVRFSIWRPPGYAPTATGFVRCKTHIGTADPALKGHFSALVDVIDQNWPNVLCDYDSLLGYGLCSAFQAKKTFWEFCHTYKYSARSPPWWN